MGRPRGPPLLPRGLAHAAGAGLSPDAAALPAVRVWGVRGVPEGARTARLTTSVGLRTSRARRTRSSVARSPRQTGVRLLSRTWASSARIANAVTRARSAASSLAAAAPAAPNVPRLRARPSEAGCEAACHARPCICGWSATKWTA